MRLLVVDYQNSIACLCHFLETSLQLAHCNLSMLVKKTLHLPVSSINGNFLPAKLQLFNLDFFDSWNFDSHRFCGRIALQFSDLERNRIYKFSDIN